MIAAVWSRSGPATVAAIVRQMIAAEGAPLIEERRGDGAILGWLSACPLRREEGGVRLGRALSAPGGAVDGNFAWFGWRIESAVADGIECRRGAFGGEPIFWAHQDDTWIVSSSLDVLLLAASWNGAKPLLDIAHLARLLDGSDSPSLASTVYRGVERLRSSERQSFPPSARATIRAPRTAASAELTGSPDTLAEVLWEAARDSVARATAGVRVVGVLAGGGVDSSGLLAATVAHARERGDLEVVPLSLDFAGRGDDRPHRRALEAALGVDAVLVAPEEARDDLRRSLVVDGRPVLYASIPLVVAAVAAGRRRGVERVLSGFLGDLILDAPPLAFLERALAGGPFDVAAVIATVLRLQYPWGTTWRSRSRQLLLNPLLRRWIPRPLLDARRRRLRRGQAAAWAGPALRAALLDVPPSTEPPPTRTPAERYLALDSRVHMLEQIDARAQLELLTGVRFVEPWMDATFVHTLARIPGWQLAYGDRERGLFRHALRGRVPDSVRLRPDKADIDPALDRMLAAAGGRTAFRGLLGAPRLAALGLVDPAALAACEGRFFARRESGVAVDDDRGDYDASWTSLWTIYAAESLCAQADAGRGTVA